MELTGTKGALREAKPSATHVTRRNEGWTSINHYNRHDTLEWPSFAIPRTNSYTFIHATRCDRTKNVPSKIVGRATTLIPLFHHQNFTRHNELIG